jgi:alkylation response protein AidB-like acyl-CoA dehydrogenase
MNLGFSTEHELLRAALRRLLATAKRHEVLDARGDEPADAALWLALAEGGWLGTAVSEAHGGSGLNGAGLCLLAEEAGRALAALPLVGSACAFTHALVAASRAAEPAGASDSLPWAALASGHARGVLLHRETADAPPRLQGARLEGHARAVPDGPSATHALVLAGAGNGNADAALVLLALPGASKSPVAAQPLDLLHPCCDIDFAAAMPPQVLARGDAARQAWALATDAHALFVAFEQLGGAEAALDAARRYSLERYAFGRPIGSFQAVKHMLADALVAIDLARSNCLFGLAALERGGDALGEAAAVARISATQAFRASAAIGTQVHGALGVTWEADCHLFYRRAQALAGWPGSMWQWKDRLVRLLQQRVAPGAAAGAMTA